MIANKTDNEYSIKGGGLAKRARPAARSQPRLRPKMVRRASHPPACCRAVHSLGRPSGHWRAACRRRRDVLQTELGGRTASRAALRDEGSQRWESE